MKKGPDPSPYEFPIFNVSHNAISPYPNPINHLYDQRYKQAYSTFIKQNQPTSSTSSKTEFSTPTSTTSSSSKRNHHSYSPSYGMYPQSLFQQQSNNHAHYGSNVLSPFHQQAIGSWQYVNQYAIMPQQHAANCPQQASKLMQPSKKLTSSNTTQSFHRSPSNEDLQSNSLSHSANNNESNYSTDSGGEKIRVRVIADNFPSSSTDPDKEKFYNDRFNPQKSTFKTDNNDNDTDNPEIVIERRVYASPNTEIGAQTVQDLLKVANRQQSDPTQSSTSPMTERIIIIDRHVSNTPDNSSNLSGKERFRTFEVRKSIAEEKTTSASTANTATPLSKTSSAEYIMPQPNNGSDRQLLYQEPKMYMTVPNNMYSITTPYVAGVNSFYPFGYYYY